MNEQAMRMVAACCLCAGIYYGARTVQDSKIGEKIPVFPVQQAVETAVMVMEEQGDASDVIAVFSKSVFREQDDAVSVSSASEIPKNPD